MNHDFHDLERFFLEFLQTISEIHVHVYNISSIRNGQRRIETITTHLKCPVTSATSGRSLISLTFLHVFFVLFLHSIFTSKSVILFTVSAVILCCGPSNSCWISSALLSSSKANWNFPRMTNTSLRKTCERAVS